MVIPETGKALQLLPGSLRAKLHLSAMPAAGKPQA